MVGSGSWPWIKSAIFIFLRLSTPGERDEENKQTEENDNDGISSQSDDFHERCGHQKVPQGIPHQLVCPHTHWSPLVSLRECCQVRPRATTTLSREVSAI